MLSCYNHSTMEVFNFCAGSGLRFWRVWWGASAALHWDYCLGNVSPPWGSVAFMPADEAAFHEAVTQLEADFSANMRAYIRDLKDKVRAHPY